MTDATSEPRKTKPRKKAARTLSKSSGPKPEKKDHPDRDRRVRQADRLARVLRVLELIQSRGRWTTKAIAEEIECSERTVYRDLDVLRFLQSIAEIKTVGHLIDSDLSHDVSWDTARQELRCQAEAEYFDIPRGRIVWDTVHRAGILYHGNETPVEAFEELARLFRLPRWEARLDEHYLTGEALEEFYRLD